MSNLNPATHPKCAAQSLESCLSLRNPMDDSPPGSSVTGILHARTVEWVAIYFSSVSSIHRDQTLFLCLLHWQEGSLPLAPPSQVHKGLNCFLVCLQLDTYTEESTEPPNSGWEMLPWGDLGPQGSRSWETPDSGTPRLAGTLGPGSTHRDAELPGDALPARLLGTCVSFTLFPEPRTGEGRAAPTSLYSWWWTRDSPCCL